MARENARLTVKLVTNLTRWYLRINLTGNSTLSHPTLATRYRKHLLDMGERPLLDGTASSRYLRSGTWPTIWKTLEVGCGCESKDAVNTLHIELTNGLSCFKTEEVAKQRAAW